MVNVVISGVVTPKSSAMYGSDPDGSDDANVEFVTDRIPRNVMSSFFVCAVPPSIKARTAGRTPEETDHGPVVRVLWISGGERYHPFGMLHIRSLDRGLDSSTQLILLWQALAAQPCGLHSVDIERAYLLQALEVLWV